MASLTVRPYFSCSFQMILIFLLTRFLRNPSELKSIKNISLLRQQMEAQAAAQKLAAQRIANLSQVESTQGPPPEFTQTPGPPTPVAQATKREASSPIPHPSSSDDLPTDLSMDADEKTRLRERLEREQSHYHHARAAAAAAAAAAAGSPVAAFAGSATILPAEPPAEDGRPDDDRERVEHEPRPAFDFRLLMPQVTLKTEQC